ncbi:hypothetical protein TKK_0012769 [Trichogramma kaykai]
MKQQVILFLALGVAACHAAELSIPNIPKIEVQGKIQLNSTGNNPVNAVTQIGEKIAPALAKSGSTVAENIHDKGTTITSTVKQPLQVLSLWEAIKNAIECIVKSFSAKFASLFH